MNTHWYAEIEKLSPCQAAFEWLKTQPSAEIAWEVCHRGDWMLWMLGEMHYETGSLEHKRIVLAACAIARLSLIYVNEGETRPLVAIEKAEAWAKNGGTTLEEVETAVVQVARASCVEAHCVAAQAAFAAQAACLAAQVVRAAQAASQAAVHAAYAIQASQAAVSAGHAKSDMFKECAKIVRVYFQEVPEIATLRG